MKPRTQAELDAQAAEDAVNAYADAMVKRDLAVRYDCGATLREIDERSPDDRKIMDYHRRQTVEHNRRKGTDR